MKTAAKQRTHQERTLRRQREHDERRAAEQREREAIASRAYAHYLRVREWGKRVVEEAAGVPIVLTDVEQQIAGGLAHLWDAPPDVIASLRRWTEPITGVRRADYDQPSRDLALHLKYQVGFLRRSVGGHLFVQETPLLGGFGVEWHRQLYNADTVRFFKGIVGLHDGGVLTECRGGSRRRVVWEIGGGWGGFAFQFKTLCPNTTYLITGMPECLLVSAVYLMTAFPDARCRFYETAVRDEIWRGWEEADFIFAPEGAVAAMDAPAIDVAVDLMTLRQMSDSRVSLHVERAYGLGVRYFFSQLPGPCFPEPLPSVWGALERRYWLHQVPPRLEAAAFAVDDFQSAPRIDDYAQLVGWRRIRI